MTRIWIGQRPGTRLRLEHLEDRSVPATFAVNSTLDEIVSGDGKLSLREAIAKANANPGADTVVVPAGIFKTAFGGEFDISDSITIQGAGAGLTVIDGLQFGRVFGVSGTAPSSIRAVFQALTIRNGSVTGGGGGIQFGNADLLLRDSVVAGNSASGLGAGISNDLAPGTGNVTLVRTTVARNVAGGVHGGGLYVLTSALTIKDSTVRRNISSGSGGGIATSGTLTVTNSTISGNTAFSFGGGIEANTVTLTNSMVSGNTAATDNAGGISAGTAILTNSTVSGNSAFGTGGGIAAFTATLNRSTVSGNTAGIDGGGIRAVTATLTNSTVSGNTAQGNGGGIWATTATLLNDTIVENVAHTGGGLYHNPGGTFGVINTIVALNLTDFTGLGPDVSGAFTSLGHNLIGDRTGSTGFTDGVSGDQVGSAGALVDPMIGPLASNGGPTKTHALLAGSKAVDHGNTSGLPATDQRGAGFARVKDGNGDGIAVVDIGAFEK
jgi:predicted outer membrane repeat protein